MKLENKNIIITGASSGIGYEMLLLLSGYTGTRIVAAARHIETLTNLAPNIYPLVVDVSSEQGVDELFAFAHQILGDIDIFVANAGLAYIEKLDKANWQHIDYIYQLNVMSPIYSLQKLMEQQTQKTKQFICTISGAGLASLPAYSLYCSSKSALHHFINTYRYEQSEQLYITAIYPVATRTQFFDKAADSTNFPLPFPQQDTSTVAKKAINGIIKNKKKIYPSLLFRIFFPIGRAFPFFLKIYSLHEKKKVNQIL